MGGGVLRVIDFGNLIFSFLEETFGSLPVSPSYTYVGARAWVPISSAKYLHFHFEIAEGQNTKIPSKYQNPFEV